MRPGPGRKCRVGFERLALSAFSDPKYSMNTDLSGKVRHPTVAAHAAPDSIAPSGSPFDDAMGIAEKFDI